MPLFHSHIRTRQFLDDYWQKSPFLFRQAFPGFTPELDINDIAGLACEELAESRLVTGSFPEHDWTLRHGPFREKDLSRLPESNWTLLVQDVEKHYPPLRTLFAAFDFLPSWRIDDLMVSVAAPGGSVGPHVDQYDVFLLQASGSRQWRIATQFDPELLADSELNVLKSFQPEHEWTLEAGDMLYLPPGVAHHGIALETGMTWSIGMRAPSSADLFQAFGEWLAVNENEGERFRDGRIEDRPTAGQVDASALQGLRGMLNREIRNPDTFDTFIGSFLSRYRLAHEPAAPAKEVSLAEVERSARRGELHHHPWTRLLWLPQGDGAVLFAAGESFPCTRATAMAICTEPLQLEVESDDWNECAGLVQQLVNRGHLYLDR